LAEKKLGGALIARVRPGSIAEEADLRPGDRLLSINDQSLSDLIDYKYLISDEHLVLSVRKGDGDLWEIEIEKEFDEDLGLEFESATFDVMRECGNRCVFCFVDQNPPGLRPSLYVYDDDYRLSCLQGNFVSLTNLTPEDWERIGRLHLSPMYVSVHAMDPDLREKLLGTPKARHIREQLDFLRDHHVTVHAQIVLCPGLNDGSQLEYTLTELARYHPSVQSVAVVPVGLTRSRESLPTLRVITRDEAAALIEQAQRLQSRFLSELGTRFVWLADEFFLSFGFPLPDSAHYEGLPQMENGVGLAREFLSDFAAAMQKAEGIPRREYRVTAVTGRLGAKVLEPVIAQLRRLDVQIELRALDNHLFGPKITVTGLLTGLDLMAQLKGKDLGGELLVPAEMVRIDGSEARFLDDITVAMLSEELGVPVVVLSGAGELVNHLLR
jgi:putative radical SAM enzyme (TIGR03279 family)